MKIKLLLDEDVQLAVAHALRKRGTMFITLRN